MLEVIHYLHIVSAVVYAGGTVSFGWIIAPSLFSIQPDARAEHFAILEKLAIPVIITSAILVVLTGIARVWISGAIGSFSDLFSGYGLMAALALLVIVVWRVFQAPSHTRLAKAIADKDTEAFGREYRRLRLLDSIALLIILGLMVAMRMGLY
ncbi:MAG: hypothetical protein ACU0C9_08180 [Paracoccaceae bacterium]